MRYDPDSRKYHSFKQDAEQLVEQYGGDVTAARDRATVLAMGPHDEAHWTTVATNLSVQKKLVDIMTFYTGYRTTHRFQFHQDRKQPHMWAVRDERGEDHLVNMATEEVEWVEFSSWPPRSV